MKKPEIRAAGAVVLRDGSSGPEVLMVHRPHYDDWSLPKGKTERSETEPVTAAREVPEETGVAVRLISPLTPNHYQVKGKHKRVDWYHAVPIDPDAPLAALDSGEVDRVEWVSVSGAMERLSYADEAQRVTEAIELPALTPLLVLRHAKAMARKDWDGADPHRPITAWGRRQTRTLVPFLAAFGVRRVISSSAVRCLQTVSLFSMRHGVPLEGWHELTEERAELDPELATRVMAQVRDETAGTGTPTVVCGHRPVLPAMLAGLDVTNRKFETAETLLVLLDASGRAVRTQALTQHPGR